MSSIPSLIVEPDDGLDPVRGSSSRLKTRCSSSNSLSPSCLIAAVIDRHNAGHRGPVMLNAKRSGGDRANDETYDELLAAGIAVQWSSPNSATHESRLWSTKGPRWSPLYNPMTKYFTLTRDYGIVTEDPQHVAQIIEVFNADWDHRDFTPRSMPACCGATQFALPDGPFHRQGHQNAVVQHPKYVDAVILDHIAAAADRGVKVKVLCGGRHGISEWDILDTFASLRTLRRFGVAVRKQKNLRVHAKLLIVDGREALVGSMNIDRSAFDLRRELGIIDHPPVVERLGQVFKEDWKISHHYEPPDPLEYGKHQEEDEFPHDHDLLHE